MVLALTVLGWSKAGNMDSTYTKMLGISIGQIASKDLKTTNWNAL